MRDPRLVAVRGVAAGRRRRRSAGTSSRSSAVAAYIAADPRGLRGDRRAAAPDRRSVPRGDAVVPGALRAGRRRGRLRLDRHGAGPDAPDGPAGAALALGHAAGPAASVRCPVLRRRAARRRQASASRATRSPGMPGSTAGRGPRVDGRGRPRDVDPDERDAAAAPGGRGRSTRSASGSRRAGSASRAPRSCRPRSTRIVMPAGGGVPGQPIAAYLVGRSRFVLDRPGRPDRPGARAGHLDRRGARRHGSRRSR